MINKVFLCGDRHGGFGSFNTVKNFTKAKENDIIIVLGDAGINFTKTERDEKLLSFVNNLGTKFVCIRGNHDGNPKDWNYQLKFDKDLDCKVWIKEQYPNVVFVPNGTVMNINDNRCLAVGGAYSPDKQWRLINNYTWFEDEQINEEEKYNIIQILNKDNRFDYVFSHTAPYNFIPINQLSNSFTNIDKTTELFLQKIYCAIDKEQFKGWYLGHYHIDKSYKEAKVHILYNYFMELGKNERI